MRLIYLILVAFMLAGCSNDYAHYPEGTERTLEFYLPAEVTENKEEIVFFTFHNVVKYEDAIFDRDILIVWMRYGKNIDSIELDFDYDWADALKPRWNDK